jgi:hypothetical protein
MADPSILGALRDPEFWRQMGRNALEVGYDIAPGVGDVRAAERGSSATADALRRLKAGDILGGAGRGAEGLAEYLSTVPGIGEVAGLAGKAASGLGLAGAGVIRGIKGYDPARVADELEIAMADPSDAAKTQIAQVSGKTGEPTGTGKTYGYWLDDTPEDATIIDVGAGKGQGIPADRPGVRRHEPFPQGWEPDYRETADIPASEFDVVMNNATMNVVPEGVQEEMAQAMLRGAKPGGTIISSSRGPGTVEGLLKGTGQPVEGLPGVRVPGRGYQENITKPMYKQRFGENVEYDKLPPDPKGRESGDTGFKMRVKPIELPSDVQRRLEQMDWNPEEQIGLTDSAGRVSIHRDYALHQVPQEKLHAAAKEARKKGMDDWNMARWDPEKQEVKLYRGIPQFMEVGPDHPQFADLVRNAGYRPFPKREMARNRRARRAVDDLAAEIQRKRGY